MRNSVSKSSVVIVLSGVLFLVGCYEDRMDLTINADGSGTVKQKLVFSERFIIASEDSESPSRGPSATIDTVSEKIADAIRISSIDQKNLPDGSRVIELEGTFSDLQKFFSSEYCREELKLRIAPADGGKAAIYCDMKMSEGGGPSISQMYAMANGLYVGRTIHVPGDIQKANGKFSKPERTVSWVTDLRDKEGLAQTRAYVEGPDAGKGFVFFDAGALKLDASVRETTVAKPDAKPSPGAESLSAEVAWVSVNKKVNAADGNAEVSDLEIGVNLTWDQQKPPVSCYTPVLASLSDDKGKDLVRSSTFKSLSKVRSHEKNKELKIRVETPSKGAVKLQRLSGDIEVITEVVTETVELKDMHDLAGKDSTGNAVLDKLEFKIKSVKGNTVKVSIGKGKDAIVKLEIFKAGGEQVSRDGSMSWGNEASYDFEDVISESDTCRVEVVVSQKTVKVPFALDSIALP